MSMVNSRYLEARVGGTEEGVTKGEDSGSENERIERLWERNEAEKGALGALTWTCASIAEALVHLRTEEPPARTIDRKSVV